MENGGFVNPTISPDDVISKLKDDGDFDRLRLKIIRKLKENEELRNSIISVVKESAALNRPGAENLKPRQLSDAIHSEVGEKVMSQISDGIWDIIRSGDHMKTEIKETVKSVYDKLLNPNGNEDGQPLSPNYMVPACKGPDNSGLGAASAGQINDPKEPPCFGHSDNHHQNKISDTLDVSESKGPPGFTHSDDDPQKKINDPLGDNESDEPPGFTHSNIHQNNQEEGPHCSDDEDSSPPGFSVVADHKPPCDGSDEDPDMPPGFGG